jgi:hypothetical protein
VPVIIGTNETISKSYRKYLINIPGKHKIKELQEKATLGTTHVLRKVLMQSIRHLTWEITLYVA